MISRPIIYGTTFSPPVRAVLLTAKYIGLDINLQEISLFKGDHLKTDYLKINPQHTVPTLDDNGKIIWDSHAIIPYIIGKYAKDDSLYPQDLYQRALIDQRLHFDSGILYPALFAIIAPFIKQKKAVICEEKVEEMHNALKIMEIFLKNDLYMVGNNLSAADFCCLATLSSFNTLKPLDSKEFPKVTSWLKRMEAIPSYDSINEEPLKKFAAFFTKLASKM